MSYPCPFKNCDVVGTFSHNLKQHLIGTRSFGGHELSSLSADEVVRRVEAGEEFILEENDEEQ